MARLIDADLVYNELIDNLDWLRESRYEDYCAIGDDIRMTIDTTPTAFDKEKVIEELDNASRCMTIEHSNYKEHLSAIDRIKAIDIVKGGGVDE